MAFTSTPRPSDALTPFPNRSGSSEAKEHRIHNRAKERRRPDLKACARRAELKARARAVAAEARLAAVRLRQSADAWRTMHSEVNWLESQLQSDPDNYEVAREYFNALGRRFLAESVAQEFLPPHRWNARSLIDKADDLELAANESVMLAGIAGHSRLRRITKFFPGYQRESFVTFHDMTDMDVEHCGSADGERSTAPPGFSHNRTIRSMQTQTPTTYTKSFFSWRPKYGLLREGAHGAWTG